MSELSGPLSERPSLAVITLRQGGDGVAYAGRLLELALTEIASQRPQVFALRPRHRARPLIGDEARFVCEIAVAQVRESDGWWIFNHVGIARAQNLIPSVIRRPYAVLLCGIEAWDPNLSQDRKRALRNASGRIAISQFTANRTSGAHPEIGHVHVCPLALLPRVDGGDGVDHDLLERTRRTSVLVVGRMSRSERYKGHDELLECWSTVVRRVPDAQLVIVGRGDDADRLRSKAEQLGVSSHVLFAGFVGDATLQALQEKAAIFALPSRGEGFGLVYLEAMRAGLACVGGVDDAAGDVIVDGETGVLVDPAHRDALAEALVRLLDSPGLCAAYGAAGRRRFEAEFTFEHYCTRLRTVLANTFT